MISFSWWQGFNMPFILRTVVFTIIFCLPVVGAQSFPPMPSDPELMLKPLVDRSGDSKDNEAEQTAPQPVSPKIITGQVKSLQQATLDERGVVDWYAWYLAAREYLGRMGGLQCALGTPIKFYRGGRIEAISFSPVCQASVAGRFFPLPAKTRLGAVILPVRAAESPPANPQEIYSRIPEYGDR
jgi:hypothetical protein